MNRKDFFGVDRVMAIVRAPTADGSLDAAEALAEGGITTIEFSMSSPAATAAISAARTRLASSIRVGAGTVTNLERLDLAIQAGAEFIVTPSVEPEVASACNDAALPVIIGAFTPTEVLQAWHLGAVAVKVFPATVGGPGYISALLEPFPDVRIVAVGGVTPTNARSFLEAGASAVGLGGSLLASGTRMGMRDAAASVIEAVGGA